jgi:hypothetical protein
MDVYAQIAEKIISQQESIIGPVAIEQAEEVPNLQVDWSSKKVTIIGNAPAVIDALVVQYQGLFGQISVEVCKEAASGFLSQLQPDQIPQTLR